MKPFVRIGIWCLFVATVMVGLMIGLERIGIRGEGVRLGMIVLGMLLVGLSDRKLFWPSASEVVGGRGQRDRSG